MAGEYFLSLTYVWRYTLSVVFVVPVLRANSVQLLDAQHLKKPAIGKRDCIDGETERERGLGGWP